MEHVVIDRFGNELRCGDNICFTASSGHWRQTPTIMRVKIYALCTDKNGTGWVMPDPENIPENCPSKILAERVVKCY